MGLWRQTHSPQGGHEIKFFPDENKDRICGHDNDDTCNTGCVTIALAAIHREFYRSNKPDLPWPD